MIQEQTFNGSVVLIPRIDLALVAIGFSIVLRFKEFLGKPAFAMSVNKLSLHEMTFIKRFCK